MDNLEQKMNGQTPNQATIEVIGRLDVPESRLIFEVSQVSNPNHQSLVGHKYHVPGSWHYALQTGDTIDYRTDSRNTVRIVSSIKIPQRGEDSWTAAEPLTKECLKNQEAYDQRRRQSDAILWDYAARQRG